MLVNTFIIFFVNKFGRVYWFKISKFYTVVLSSNTNNPSDITKKF